MRTANLSKHLHVLFILICVICIFSVFPLAANGTSLADLAGKWNYSGFASGLDAPSWERGTGVVNPNGTFTFSGTRSDGNVANSSGAFSISSKGIGINTGKKNNALCQIDLDNTVLVCTETSPDGSTKLITLTKQADSYAMADMVGNWEGNFLYSEPNAFWVRFSQTVNPDGTFTGTLTTSDGSSGNGTGQGVISQTSGTITCPTGCPDSNSMYFVDAGKTVSVGTGGAISANPDATLLIFTKKADSYSMDDLVGIWKGNHLASGPGSPWWERETVTIKPDGTVTAQSVESNSSKIHTHTGALSLSSDGVITCSSGCEDSDIRLAMNAGKTVMAETDTWSDGTAALGIFTKSAGLPGVPAGVIATPGNAQAKVSFTPPAANGSPITGYTVTSDPVGIKVKGLKSPIVVKGLTNGTVYTFSVTATNKIGNGQASTPITVTPATKPGAPTGITATAGDGKVSVTFTPPASTGGSDITDYTVTWHPNDGADTNAGDPPTTHTHIVTGLTNGKVYTFKVEATNAMGTGPTSHSIKVKPQFTAK